LENSQTVDDTNRLLLQIYKAKKDFSQAFFFAEESLRLAEKTQDEDFRMKLNQYALLQIADLKYEINKEEEALRDYDSVIELLRKMPELQLDNYAAHKGKLLCLQRLGKTQEMQTELEMLLTLSENYRTQILEDESRNTFFDNEQMVFDVAVENALDQGSAEKAFEYAETSRARTLLDFMSGETSVIGLEKKFPKISKPLSLAQIRQKMPPDAQLIVYSVLPAKLAIWIISNEKFDYTEKQISADETKRKVADFLELIKTERENSTRIKESSAELFEILIAPVFPKLDGAKEIFFVPDKTLNFLPFGALFSKVTNKFLIEDFAVMTAPSASVFVTASDASKQFETIKDESLLSVGNPKFDFRENPNLLDLPSAEVESREVSKLYPNNRQFIGADATKPNVLSELNEKNIFHFAGHYVTNEASAPNSKLLLANSDLRVSELTEMRLTKTKLVVLSACETANEKLYQGEGAIGAARTFLAIGAPLVLASGWKIDSEAAKDLMISFHHFRREKGLRSAEALRQAQIEMLNGADPNYQTPYFWSAFSLVGGYTNY
jgi:CHAT domain-containing protein